MNHQDHVALLRPGIPGPGGVWADLGAGSGAFTIALADLVGPTATIYAVDRDRAALDRLRAGWRSLAAPPRLETVVADVARPLALPPVDGAVMANVLHFFRDHVAVLRRVHDILRPGAPLLLVEYNVDDGNVWVPHPLAYATFAREAATAGFVDITWLTTRPSRFLREIYSARALRVVTEGYRSDGDRMI